jgi:hypothetical protein
MNFQTIYSINYGKMLSSQSRAIKGKYFMYAYYKVPKTGRRLLYMQAGANTVACSQPEISFQGNRKSKVGAAEQATNTAVKRKANALHCHLCLERILLCQIKLFLCR